MRRVTEQRGQRRQQRTLSERIETALVYGLAYAFLGLVAISAIVVAYWLKSAAGINVFEGHSPLHDLFY